MLCSHLPADKDWGRSSRVLHPCGPKASTRQRAQTRGSPPAHAGISPRSWETPSIFPRQELRGARGTWGGEGRAALGAALCLPATGAPRPCRLRCHRAWPCRRQRAISSEWHGAGREEPLIEEETRQMPLVRSNLLIVESSRCGRCQLTCGDAALPAEVEGRAA